MRQNNNSKRSRGRHNRKSASPRNQIFDSNGPSVRIRGHALQIFEKYTQLSRDASSSGDRVGAENLQQHAEHYYRVASANGAIPTPVLDEDGLPVNTNTAARQNGNSPDQNTGQNTAQNLGQNAAPADRQNNRTSQPSDTSADAPERQRHRASSTTAQTSQPALNGAIAEPETVVEAKSEAPDATAPEAPVGETPDSQEEKPASKPRRRGRRSRGAKSGDASDGTIESDNQKVA